MFWHLVLGFLRDGRPRHGYELITEYKGHFGEKLNPGNLYRELARLAGEGLVKNGVNPPGADPRRIPYQITERGRALEAAVAKLPKRQRAAIVLTYTAGLRNADAASAMDISVKAFEALLVRAKRELRDHLAGEGWMQS